MRLRDHAKEELSFYSKATTDIEYLFPFGWVSSGALQTARTTTSSSIRSTPARAWNISTRRPTSATSPMWWSRPSARTV